MVAGIALALSKSVLLLENSNVSYAVDFREMIASYGTQAQMWQRIERPFLHAVIARLQDVRLREIKQPKKLLEQLDIGDVAAENEIRQLRSYFVYTGQFNQAKRGGGRIVTGRKGSGKTAIFYALRDSFDSRRSHLVLDLKPEGPQFTRLREVVLDQLSPGLQEHTLTAFWNYILLCEMAQNIVDYEVAWARRDAVRSANFDKVESAYSSVVALRSGDLSERLLDKVNRMIERFELAGRPSEFGKLTQTLFLDDIPKLDDALSSYLQEKEEVWMLIDNLDKGWPTRGARTEDVLIVRMLLEATRKIQRQFQKRNVVFRSVVFIRNDIYDLLVGTTPDKGKENPITLDWDDREVFKQIVKNRIQSTVEISGTFEEIWAAIADTHVGTRESFDYVVDRTLMRPRDLLNFLHRAIEVSINRGHDRIMEDDLKKAEARYSDDMVQTLSFELRDVYPNTKEVLYNFYACKVHLTRESVYELLQPAGFAPAEYDSVIERLVWFGFLGVTGAQRDEPVYAYQVRYNLSRLMAQFNRGGVFVVHPAFRSALDCVE
jgi:hypothetical protein